MNQARLRHSAIAILVPFLLVACGGSDPVPVAEDQFVGKIASAKPGTRLAASNKRPLAADISISLTAADLFNWAEGQYPELFPKGPQNFPLTDGGINYTVRAYPNGNYLGEANGIVYGLGDFTNGQIQSFGRMADYTCQVFPAACNPPPTAALNECIDPAAALLPTGFRVKLVFELSGPLTGEQTVESVIDGPDLFEGVSAVRITSTMSGSNTVTVSGFPITSTTTSTTKSYELAGSSGNPWSTLGAVTDGVTTTGGIVVSPGSPPIGATSTPFGSKTVYTPPDQNTEFTLALHASLTKTVTSTTTVTAPPGVPPSTATSSDTYTFEEKEPKIVFGKTYDTCRYKMTTAGDDAVTTTWYIVGKGVPVQIESASQGVVQTTRLKSGTYNGVPI